MQQLHAKIESYGLVFKEDAKNKNRRALVGLNEMGIRPSDRRGYIMRLTPFDYCQGPFNDLDNPPPGKGDLWVFGQLIGKTDFYIKVQIGAFSQTPVCVSFHEVEKSPLRRAFTV
ncbi:hypothetical protein [Hymenobacter armeniacus]|uniref:Toxin n=1 Tax=Hymenobacter armeniacus TaxID=2771358 RepID=A0ABR8JXC2_9BACT|nr:hypothetical protein [Hymenobacter armeniacus]MBD2722579.1 hypothetical protein [Hymenobacter armeniacus]